MWQEVIILKKQFIELLLNENDNRLGMDKLIEFLQNETDFFIAPASVRNHGAESGGLLFHSLAVHKNIFKLSKIYGFDSQIYHDSLTIISLLHDVCKANFYKEVLKWRKNENNRWEQYPSWDIDDQLPLGHGEKSARIVSKFINLTDDEYAAIRWHMGAWGTEDYSGRQSLNAAMEKYPLVLLLQMADLAASYYDKK